MNYKHTKESIEKIAQAGRNSVANKRQIIQLNTHGQFIMMYASISEASRRTGVNRRAINNALVKKSGIQLSGGFVWRYAKDLSPEQKLQLVNEQR